ncbi:MAG TPA: hypothetical protein VF614_13995 [Chthoniobacteraceae bacterium]
MLRRVILTLLVLAFATLVGACWYAYDKGFTRKWRGFVTDEFRKRGLEVSLRRMKLEPFRGIVAKDVQIYDARDRQRTVGVIDEMLLVIDYANLFRGETFLNALELRDANLSLPLNPENPRGPKLEISKLSGRLFLPPQQIYLSRLEAELYGIRLTASGRLINPQSFPVKKAGEQTLPVALFERIIDELQRLRFESGSPQLDIRFSGDLAQLDRVLIQATFWGEKIRRQDYLLESLYLNAAYRDGAFDLKQLIAVDSHGSLQLGAGYNPATGDGSLRLQSKLDLQGLLRALPLPQLDDLVLYTPPLLELNATMQAGKEPRLQVLGHVEVARFAYRAVVFESLTTDLAWEPGRWAARDVRLVHRSGEVKGDVMQLPNAFRSRLSSTMNRQILLPLLPGNPLEWLPKDETELRPANLVPNAEAVEAR